MSATGIPIELMFGALGALICVVYGNMIYEIRALRKSSVQRDRLLVVICDRLKIAFNPGD